MITTNIIQRTFFLNYGDDLGSGFTIERHGRQYIISAKHVFESVSDKEEVEISIFHDNSWKKLKCTAIVHPNEDVDVIIFSYEGQIGPTHPIQYLAGGLVVGQDTFFLGFPYGKYSPDDAKINNSFPFPFVKKGVCSALHFDKEKDSKLIYLDGHTNPGFSGGPVVFKDIQTGELKVCGIMRGYLPHEGKINTEYIDEEGNAESDYLLYDENSGIIVCQMISDAIDLLDKHAPQQGNKMHVPV